MSTRSATSPTRRSPRGRCRTSTAWSCSRSSSDSLEPFADAFLPAAAFLEKEGHVTTWEGRNQRIRPIRGAAGIALPDWEIFASLALAAGGDLGFETLDELHEEMGRLLAPRESTRRAPSPGAAPARSPVPEGSLHLFTYPLLVDEGRLSERADELKAALEDEPFLEIHPNDAAPRGVIDGGAVDRAHRGRGGRAPGARDASTSSRARCSCRSTSRGSPRTRCSRGRSRSRRRSSRSTHRSAASETAERCGGGCLMDWLDWLLLIARVAVVFFALLISVLLYVWMERKVIADFQTRKGPMRAGPRGILVTLADGIKLFFKEGITPTNADRPVYVIAPRPGDVPGVPGVRGDPVRDAASRSSAGPSRSSSRTWTSASCGCWP